MKMTEVRLIDNTPTIEPEVRHGRWNYRHEDGWCYCTACGKDADVEFERDYCPNCGARMDGGADNANQSKQNPNH